LQSALRAPQAAEIALARARMRQATALRLNAQRDYDEIADQPDAESSDEALALEAAKLEYEAAQAQFDLTMGGTPELELLRLAVDLDQARAALERAEAQLADTRLVAPFQGTVMRVIPGEGENIGGYTPALVLADLSVLEIRAEIDELDVAAAAAGQQVELTFDAFPGEVVPGTLTQLMPGPNDSRGTVIYEGMVHYQAPELAVRPGMGANLTIVTLAVENTLLVPRRAVQDIGRHQVVRTKSGRREEPIIVTTGLSNDAEIEILSGLEEGQVVLLD
jgi:RND family efflux transporter MFP subunit